MLLVTGATGMNGLAVMREFARHKQQVRALVRSRAKAQVLETLPGVEIAEGDMLRPETLGAALDGVERALMISSADEHMVETQCAFIDASKRAGVRHIVKFSGAESCIGYDPGKFRFTRMHEQIERYLEGSGLAWTHLRPSQFMQVYLREVPTITAKDALFLPFENISLSPVDVEDVAKAAFRLMCGEGHEAKSYDMTGPEALTMTEVAARISEAIGRMIRYVAIAPEERRRALLAAGLPLFMADALDEQTSERRRRPNSRVYLGTHAALGVEPTTFAEFARRKAAAFRGEGAS